MASSTSLRVKDGKKPLITMTDFRTLGLSSSRIADTFNATFSIAFVLSLRSLRENLRDVRLPVILLREI
uniref:CSON002520 protein n=1 Tax=Culicoides sonorensis TaxID=179676 RepID=A0A336LUX6_CULSO